MPLTVPGGQVKTGGSQYIADSLAEMASKPGYGRTGYVDARFVNPDGTPRVAPDAFTNNQAQRLLDAKVRLRGIRDLDVRGEALVKNIVASGKDGLDPVARKQQEQLHDDIAHAYEGRGIAGRVAGGMAIAAATAAIVSLVVQYKTIGQVDFVDMSYTSGKAAGLGGAGALADAGLYHLAKRAGMAIPKAKAFAQEGVASGFCLLAVGADAFAEIRSARNGDATAADAAVGVSFKAVLDILPLVMAPLGLSAIPFLLAGQIGGRWALAKVRDMDRKIELEIVQSRNLVDEMDRRIAAITEQSDESDRIFERVMGRTNSWAERPRLVRGRGKMAKMWERIRGLSVQLALE